MELLEPCTNDDYERPPRDYAFKTDDYESTGARNYKSGEGDQANTHDFEEEPSHQLDLSVRAKDSTQPE